MSTPARVGQVLGETSAPCIREGPQLPQPLRMRVQLLCRVIFIKSCGPELLLLNLLAEHMRPSMSPKANIRTPFLETVFVCRRTVEIVSFLEP